MQARDWLRFVLPGALAAFRTGRTAQVALRRDVPRRALWQSLPLVATMQMVHALGESVGYARGPGNSPNHLH
jgi:hypothetical protein